MRLAFRSLGKDPGFLIAAILTIALGVGANTAVFSVLKAVALTPLPYREPDQLVTIAEADGHTPNPQNVSFGTVLDWRRRSRSFSALSLYQDSGIRTVERGQSEILRGMRVNYDFFDTLGIKMLLGRTFLPEDDRPAAHHKLILSYRLWKRKYGGDPSAVGRVIHAADGSYTIVGILPADFHPLHMTNPGEVPQLFVPLGYDLNEPPCRTCRVPRLIGRLKPGVTAGQARAELNSIMHQLAREYPADYARDAFVVLTPFRDQFVGNFQAGLWVLFAAVGLLLLLACANVANLVLVRAIGRSKEFAVRAALGAGRMRIAGQILTESLVVALAGGAAGTAAAYWVTGLISRLGTSEIPRLDEIGPDAGMLAWGLGISAFTGILFGLTPALQASRTDLQSVLRAEAGATQSGSKRRFQQALIAAEIALAFVLVLGVGLLGKSYRRLLDVDLGYDPAHVLTMSLLPDWSRYDTDAKRLRYFEDVALRVRGVPGVESAAYASTIPLSHSDSRRLYIRDSAATGGDVPHVDAYFVSADYFRAMKTPLLRGRLIDARDQKDGAPVAVISESCARQQFPGRDPIGLQIQLDDRDEHAPWATIVGIAGDVHQYGLDKPPDAAVYLALAQAANPQGWGSLIVRCSLDLHKMERPVTEAVRSVDPALPIFHLQPMDAYISKSMAQRTFILLLIAVFGVLALTLATVGVYGVVSYSVAARGREVGIRMALGAQAGDVVRLILGEVSVVALAGLAAGLCVSMAGSGLLQGLLFGVSPNDWATIASAAALILAAALLAGYLPAHRAAGEKGRNERAGIFVPL